MGEPPMGEVPMGQLLVREVRSRRDRGRFLGLPYELHRADPLWVPPLRRDVGRALSAGRNPFFEHGAVALFLASRGKRVVGRVAAVENRAHNEFHGDRVGFFGFFECEDDPAAAAELLGAAGEWLRGRGLDAIRGPCSLSTNDECGLLVEGFDVPPTLLTPHNPPYYASLVEGAGLSKAKDLWLFQRTSDGPMPERLRRAADVVAKRHDVRVRSLDKRRFDRDVALIRGIYEAAWERNWGFVPMTPAELRHLARDLRPVVVPEMVAFAECDGEAVGFAVALPDLNVPLRGNRSGRLLPGLLRILRARRIPRCRILLLGVLPRFQSTGVDALLYQRIWERAVAAGAAWGEAGWVLEDNAPMRNGLVRMGFEHYRTLRLYQAEL